MLQVLPLVRDTDKRYRSGWCSYVYYFPDTPDLEIMCGGINTKTVLAGGLWRQGNLLHFGFDLSPVEMNDIGKALLVNSIVYISRFTEDRPIPIVPSVFAGQATRHRMFIDRTLSRKDLSGSTVRYLKMYVSEDTLNEAGTQDIDGLKEYFGRVRDYLFCLKDGKIAVDRDAVQFGVPPSSPRFLDEAIAGLSGNPDRSSLARRLLGRYRPPESPAPSAHAGEWTEWLTENRDYLFFCDGGWYRWHIDPLAKKRGVPSNELRGSLRASRP